MDYGSESDTSDKDLTTATAPGQHATIEQLREALKQEQLKNQKLVEMNKKLRGPQGDTGVLTAPGKKGKNSKADADIPAQLVGHVEQINRLGKKSAVMLALWIPDEIFTKKRPSIDYTDATRRYASPENEIEALTAELYDFLPKEYHAHIRGLPKFGDIFKFGCGACRSSALYNIRSKAAIIFNLNNEYFSGDHSLKDCEEILKLLGYKKKDNSYDTWPLILYPDNVKNSRKPFRNAALPLILKVALHGAGALNSVSKGKPKVNAQLWGVTSVNDAGIAFSAIMARFVLSKDTEFAVKGGVTGIKYQADYWKYRKMLAKADEAARQSLIDFFNKTVFPNHSHMPLKKKDDGDEEDEEDLTDAIAAFNLGADDSLTEDDHATEDTPVSPSDPDTIMSTSHHAMPTPAAQPLIVAGTNSLAEEHNGVSADESPNDPHDELVHLVKGPNTTKKNKKAAAANTPATNRTGAPRVARNRKGSAKESTNEKKAKDQGGQGESTAMSNAFDSPIPAQKPTSRRSNIVMSDEDN